VRWDTENLDERVIFVHSELLSRSRLLEINVKKLDITYLSFAPDGKWLVIVAYNGRLEKSYFIAVPVTGEHHEKLLWNELVILGHPEREFNSLTWSTAPTALVASDGDSLYRWDLGELHNARVIVVPEEDEERKSVFMRKKISVLKRIACWFGLRKF
jgi:hypothetical protein